ncbi:MAG: 16S rRNA (guanine(527)-N(7))-methyltransferase RsmG [Prevotella sp.]|nr:16S rRNA (guanine(527)-N(7))-methyltransferase RsmG [Prevotella sp.]
MEIVLKYFPDISVSQRRQLEALDELYQEWNTKINVISRKDIDNLYEHHVLHSLAIAKMFNFQKSTTVLDFGTGGGFPGIPLAIMFPDVKFKLIDGTGKKIKVVKEVINAIGLHNCVAEQRRGENERGIFDFIVCRAVMPFDKLVAIVRKNVNRKGNNSIPNGIICLKGGNIDDELGKFRKNVEITEISDVFQEDWFTHKYVIYLPL